MIHKRLLKIDKKIPFKICVRMHILGLCKILNIMFYSLSLCKVPVPLNRKESYDYVIISFVVRPRMQIM